MLFRHPSCSGTSCTITQQVTILVNELQGGEFSKEIVATLQERSLLEASYAKGLSKLSAKLFKASKDATVPVPTTVANAWHFIAEDMEEASEVHRNMASILDENLVRPLKVLRSIPHFTWFFECGLVFSKDIVIISQKWIDIDK